jgi:hypothetical protein
MLPSTLYEPDEQAFGGTAGEAHPNPAGHTEHPVLFAAE